MDPAHIDRCIGSNMKKLRLRAGCSQQDIAALFGVVYQQIQKYEKGESRIPARMLVILGEFYGIPYGAFLKGLEQKTAWREGGKSLLPEHDSLTSLISDRIATIKDTELKRKIGRIVDILAT